MEGMPSGGQCEPRCRGGSAQGFLETKNQVICLGQRVERPVGDKAARSAGPGRMTRSTVQARLVSAHMWPLRLLREGAGRGDVQSGVVSRLIWLQRRQRADGLERGRDESDLGKLQRSKQEA